MSNCVFRIRKKEHILRHNKGLSKFQRMCYPPGHAFAGSPCSAGGTKGENVAGGGADQPKPDEKDGKIYCTGTKDNYRCTCPAGRKFRNSDYGCTTAATDAEIDKCKGRPGNQKYYAPGLVAKRKKVLPKLRSAKHQDQVTITPVVF